MESIPNTIGLDDILILHNIISNTLLTIEDDCMCLVDAYDDEIAENYQEHACAVRGWLSNITEPLTTANKNPSEENINAVHRAYDMYDITFREFSRTLNRTLHDFTNGYGNDADMQKFKATVSKLHEYHDILERFFPQFVNNL